MPQKFITPPKLIPQKWELTKFQTIKKLTIYMISEIKEDTNKLNELRKTRYGHERLLQ